VTRCASALTRPAQPAFVFYAFPLKQSFNAKDTKGREGKAKHITTKDTKGHAAKQALDATTPHGVIPAQAGIHFDV
jgi:hypothetical protein